MNMSMVRDTLAARGYHEIGRPLCVDGLDLELEVLTGERSNATLVILWDGTKGYASLRRQILALRSLVAHSGSPRPIALVVTGSGDSIPPEFARLVRIYVVPATAVIDDVAPLLAGLLPLQVRQGDLSELDVPEVILGALPDSADRTDLAQRFAEAAWTSRGAVEQLMAQLVEESLKETGAQSE